MEQFKVIIVGWYGNRNLGDDALMLANFEVMKKVYEPGEIAFVCKPDTYLSRIIPGAQVIPHDPHRRLKGEILVYGGGTQFYSFPLTRERNSFLMKLKAISSPRGMFLYLHDKVMPAKWVFEKRIALGIGVGPFVRDSKEETYASKLFKELDCVSVRDPASYGLCAKWGVERLTLGSDLCYMKELWGMPEIHGNSKEINKNNIGIIIRDWPHTIDGARFVGPLLEAAAALSSEGFGVTFISLCPASDEQCLEILKTTDYEVMTWDPSAHSVGEFVKSLARFAIIVTARYHGAVLASTIGIPVVTIDIEQKLSLVSGILSDQRYSWHPPFDAIVLCRLVKDILNSYQQVKTVIDSAVYAQRCKVAEMLKELYFIMQTNVES